MFHISKDMENRFEIISLLNEKSELENKLKSLTYGTPEIREKGGKKYVYVHYRENGVSLTKYVGEFSDELYNSIISASLTARQTKKQIRSLEKKLASLGHKDTSLPESVLVNIDYARKYLADTIYNQAVLEGIATTYADTETIIEGGKVNNMNATDVMKLINMKRAWEFILNKDVLMSPTDFSLLAEINRLIEDGFYYNAGKLRSTPVSIGGTSWKPPLPIETVIKEELAEIFATKKSVADKAIELLLYTMKKQIFIDGNKRTAVIFANHFLISNAKGLIVIPNEKVEDYKKLLLNYYEGKDEKSIKTFLKKFAYKSI